MEGSDRLQQILQLEPSQELRFKGPFDEVVPSKLELSNPSEQPVSFKVKTTAPRRYCVRPNSGVVKPHSKVSVMLMLQPFEYNPQEKNKHKFMVQALFTPDSDISIDELFKQAKPEQLMETKLRCVFEMPAGEAAAVAVAAAPASAAAPQAAQPAAADAAAATTASGAAGGDSQLAAKLADCQETIAKLQAECSNLRQETRKLKEENKQLSLGGGGVRGSGLPTVATAEAAAFSQTHLLLAALMVLIGYLTAKFIF